MLYFDTSFLMPLLRPEASSAAISAFLADAESQELAISLWTRLEVSSALARDVRMGALRPDAAMESAAQFDAFVQGFEVFLPDTSDFDLAITYLRRFNSALRGGDALHLAIASNRGASAIHTLDKTMAKAGKMLRLPVRLGT